MQLLTAGSHHAVFDLGGVRVISLLDGYVDMPVSRLRDSSGQPLDPVPDCVELVTGRLRLSVNAFFVDDGDHSLLIDTGASNSWHPTMGSLPDALREAGIDPASIRDVAITHTHEDHVNGLVASDGSDSFTALQRVFVGAGDTDVFDRARLKRFRDKVVHIGEPRNITDRVTAFPSPGHTPGHTVYNVRGRDGSLTVWGDTVHVPTLQFAQPEVTWELDDNRDRARQTRLTLLAQLNQPGQAVAGAHLNFPGVGRVTAAGSGYQLEYVR